MISKKSFFISITLGEKVYTYDALNERINKTFSVRDFEEYLAQKDIKSLEIFKRDYDIFKNCLSGYHHIIIEEYGENKTLVEKTLRNSFGKIKGIIESTTFPFFPSSDFFEEIDAALVTFYEDTHKSLAKIEKARLENIKGIDSGLCDLIDNAELLKEGDYEKYIYESLANAQKEGKKFNMTPNDINFILGYIEKKRTK